MIGGEHRPAPVRGLHHDRYWEYCGRGELRLQQCDECGHPRYPPGPVCPECLSAACTWVPMSGRGALLAWTVFHRQYFPAIPPPYTVAAVETDEGPIVIGNLVGTVPGGIAHGMRLHTTFEDIGDEESRWRICQWTPATEE